MNEVPSKVSKECLGVLITSLSLKGLSGIVRVRGYTDRGLADASIKMVKGEIVDCMLSLEGGVSFSGPKCLEIINSLVCVECFINTEPVGLQSVGEGSITLRTFKVSHPVCNQVVIANLVNASESRVRVDVKASEALNKLAGRFGSGLSFLIAFGEGFKATALAFDGRIVDACVWVKGLRYCGEDALSVIRSKESLRVTAYLLKVNTSRLVRSVRDSILKLSLKAGVK